MELYPINLPGSLIAVLTSNIAPASPEQVSIIDMIKKSYCLSMSSDASAMAGYFSRNPERFLDILMLAPDFLEAASGIWVENTHASTLSYGTQQDFLSFDEVALKTVIGHFFFVPEDLPGHTGIVSITSTGQNSHGEIVRGGFTILPYVMYVNTNLLRENMSHLAPRRIDISSGYLHKREKDALSLEEITEMLSSCIRVSEIKGLLIDAGIIGDMKEHELEQHAQKASLAALKAIPLAISSLICAQVDGLENGPSGYFKNIDGNIVWRRRLLRLRKQIPAVFMADHETTGQVTSHEMAIKLSLV